MDKLLLEQESATEQSAGAGCVTRGMVRKRAVELAVNRGRSAQTVTKGDWEQARLELTSAKAQTGELPPVSGPALERWENEGGVIPDCADTTANLGNKLSNEPGK